MPESNKHLTSNYPQYKYPKIKDRLFDFETINKIITEDFKSLQWEEIGKSFSGNPIRQVKVGNGSIKLMLWSQMHGDEPTATAALFDILTFLMSNEDMALNFKSKLSIYIIPVVNPDGLTFYTRQNAQKIDINRDYLSLQSPEAKILKTAFEKIKPDFAFNLHDQSSLFCTPKNNPVGISMLAPSADAKLNVTWNREQAMKIIAQMNHLLQGLIPQQVARFKDEYEPRAFGDNFQKSCPTILIESGFLKGDTEKQYIRELNFHILITAFNAISNQIYQEIDLMNYLMIPIQSQDLYHLIIKNCRFKNTDYTIDIGLNIVEKLDANERKLTSNYTLMFIGDLSTKAAYETIEGNKLFIEGDLNLDKVADFKLINSNEEIIYHWKLGIRV